MGEVITTDHDRLASLRKLTHILYALYAIFWLTGGITALIAIVIGYVKRDDTQGTLYASHFAWQIRSFWWSVAWATGARMSWAEPWAIHSRPGMPQCSALLTPLLACWKPSRSASLSSASAPR